MEMTRKQHLLCWRGLSFTLIVVAHSWAVAALLKPTAPKISPADSGYFGVSLQFSRAAKDAPQALKKTHQTSMPNKEQTSAPISPKPLAPRNMISPSKASALKEHQNSNTTKKQLTANMNRAQHPAQQPPKQNQASGAHQATELSTPLFAAPPTPPRYPSIARKRGQEGTVWLDVWLDEEGRQSKLAIAKSSGLKVFDVSALDAVQSWQFQAYKVNGVGVISRVRLPVEFRLH